MRMRDARAHVLFSPDKSHEREHAVCLGVAGESELEKSKSITARWPRSRRTRTTVMTNRSEVKTISQRSNGVTGRGVRTWKQRRYNDRIVSNKNRTAETLVGYKISNNTAITRGARRVFFAFKL